MQKIIYLLLFITVSFYNVNSQSLLSKESEEVFSVVEDMPIPWFYKNECIDVPTEDKQNCYYIKLKQHLSEDLYYPEKALNNKTEGVVIVQFVISKDGSITDSEIVKDIGDECGTAALKVISDMPNWVPGKQRGKPVNVRYTLPVKFQLKK